MDFYQMKQILTIAQTGSISEAAKLLCVSQPAVSHALAKAEQALLTLNRAFEGQFEKLMENELMDMDADIRLLKQTMKMEGYEE